MAETGWKKLKLSWQLAVGSWQLAVGSWQLAEILKKLLLIKQSFAFNL